MDASFFDGIVSKATAIYPDIQIKYKNESTFMKILGKIMFFNPGFMTQYTTTLGATVYFPNRQFVELAPVTSAVVFLHELTHIYDEKRLTAPLYTTIYSLPQTLFLLAAPILFFLVGWKFALLSLLFLLPIPAYFRKNLEERAYTMQLYVLNQLNVKYNYNIDLENKVADFASQFKTSAYYWMWPFTSETDYFTDLVYKLKSGQKPNYEADLINMIDKILS
jgi:hypothetical protein